MTLLNAIPPIPNRRVVTNYERLEGRESFLCVHTDIPMYPGMPGYNKADALTVENAVEQYKRRLGMADVKTVWK
jgi:hypothetical protein